MCGIAAVWGGSYTAAEREHLVKSMLVQLIHRGPDGERMYSNPDGCMGIARLAINDVASGWQPFSSNENRITSVVNGEIYNFKSLKDKLENMGVSFSSKNDCEVIPHLLALCGDKFLIEHTCGMYAFASFDSQHKEFKIGRDPNGEKPLYFTKVNGAIFVCSEIAALQRVINRPLQLEVEPFINYLNLGFNPGENSIISGIYKLKPGTILTFDSYCNQLNETTSSVIQNEGDLSDFDGIINEVLEQQLISDVPIGVALSSGLDSSLLARLATQNLTQKITAISVGYEPDEANDERCIAKRFCEEIGIDFVSVHITIDEIVTNFDEYVNSLNEPISDYSGYSYYKLGKTAKDLGIKVLLFGHGMDEYSFGYAWMRRVTAFNRMRNKEISKLGLVYEYIAASLVDINLLQPKATMKEIYQSIKDFRFLLSRSEAQTTFEISANYREFERINNIQWNDWLSTMQNTFVRDTINYVGRIFRDGYLRENGFNQLDALTMANSIEARCPLSDQRILLQVNRRYEKRIRYLKGKRIFSKLYAKYLPTYIIKRSKTGFGAPSNTIQRILIERADINKTINNIRSVLPDDRKDIDSLLNKIRLTGSDRVLYKMILLDKWLTKFRKLS